MFEFPSYHVLKYVHIYIYIYVYIYTDVYVESHRNIPNNNLCHRTHSTHHTVFLTFLQIHLLQRGHSNKSKVYDSFNGTTCLLFPTSSGWSCSISKENPTSSFPLPRLTPSLSTPLYIPRKALFPTISIGWR